MTRLVYRPLDVWPGKLLPEGAREGHQFRASWSNTLDLLGTEVEALGASEVVLQVAADERAMRLDGGLRADARPSHPGVIVSFDTKAHGPLRYFTDRFTHRWSGQLPGWQANVRAIALALEALRKVERFGVANRGEQYTGWSALPSGAQTTEQYQQLLLAEADYVGPWPTTADEQLRVYRMAMRRAHPDHGGSTDRMMAVRNAATYLGIVTPLALGAATA